MNKTLNTMPNSGANTDKDSPCQRLRVVFFGNERIATGTETSCPTLQKLITASYDVAAVVISEDVVGKSRKKRPLEITDLAALHEIPVFNPRNLTDITTQLKNYSADIGILVAYGKLVPQEIIDLFPSGIVNIHPSLLPLHRGSTPIESVILGNEVQTGVSLMALAKEMDAGHIYAYSQVVLDGTEQKQALADDLLELGSEMLIATLPRIVSGDITGMPQDDLGATYDKRIEKKDGLINLSKAAVQLEREVRAYSGWPGSRTVIANKDVVITAAHVADNTLHNVDKKTIFIANKQLCLQTADDILVIDALKPAGKPAMPASAFLAGYKQFLD